MVGDKLKCDIKDIVAYNRGVSCGVIRALRAFENIKYPIIYERERSSFNTIETLMRLFDEKKT